MTQAWPPLPSGNPFDAAVAGVYEAREADWRCGALTYQIIVDRFVPSPELESKRHLYPAPKRLRAWDERPTAGHFHEEARVWTHEIDFWGGDLRSAMQGLDHIQGLGMDVLYLNPIVLAYTNHKYDALDYHQISPEYGTWDDFAALARACRERGLKLVLDGVLNHVGRQAPIFQSALSSPSSPYRDWFEFHPDMPGGARCWSNAENLPELQLENPAVQHHLWAGPNSVVRHYLQQGADGWRLDVAHDIGMDALQAITQAAHDEKPGSLVVGELCTYPKEWFPSVDGVMNFTWRHLILRCLSGQLSARSAAAMVARMVGECGVENLLRSWVLLDNHDTERLAHALPRTEAQRLAQLLQFTLPGAPNLYYGSELGMSGGGDPEMRAPMRWDWVTDSNPTLQWTRQLVALRQQHRALRIGDYRPISSERLWAFERHTDRVEDTVMVFINPSEQPVRETVMVANSKLMNASPVTNLLEPDRPHSTFWAGLLEVEVPAMGALLLKPDVRPHQGYTTYKRVQ